VGLGGLEPPTSPLSGVRSSHLSYRPNVLAGETLTRISIEDECAGCMFGSGASLVGESVFIQTPFQRIYFSIRR
jgi:hypothetical protein